MFRVASSTERLDGDWFIGSARHGLSHSHETQEFPTKFRSYLLRRGEYLFASKGLATGTCKTITAHWFGSAKIAFAL